MKTLLYFTILIGGTLIYFSCSKTDKINDVGDPIRYKVYFEILKRDSSAFEEGNVEISEAMEMIDNELTYPGDEIRWHAMKFDTLVSTALKRTIFEPIVFSGWSSEWNFSGQTEWNQNVYYLIKYLGDDIDTLRINENTTVEPRRQVFNFFLNEKPKKEIIITNEGQSAEEPWILLIRK